jgi:hypothetical protein
VPHAIAVCREHEIQGRAAAVSFKDDEKGKAPPGGAFHAARWVVQRRSDRLLLIAAIAAAAIAAADLASDLAAG